EPEAAATPAETDPAVESALVPVELESWDPEPAPRTRKESTPARGVDAPRERRPRSRPPAPNAGEYVLPPMELLDVPAPRPKRSAADTDANIAILENTLAQFRIEAQVVEIADGPSITRYE